MRANTERGIMERNNGASIGKGIEEQVLRELILNIV